MYEYFNEEEFEEKIVQVNRVSKKTAGGNKIGFSVLVVVGDRKGRVGVGLGKAPSVQDSIRKGSLYAKKHLISIPMVGTTIPHEVFIKRGAAKVLLKPASKGTGVIAGGAVRAVVEAAGIHDILSKVLGTSNQASNVYATMEALKKLAPVRQRELAAVRGEEKPIEKRQTSTKAKTPLKKPLGKRTTRLKAKAASKGKN
ncbi:MAG: 30S ribosomal protein S5 [Candidatus Woykebacteria bacterium]